MREFNIKNLNEPLFVTAINKVLNDQKVSPELMVIINEYIIGNKISFVPSTSHNPYKVVDGFGLLEFYDSAVDVTDVVYVEYVNSIRNSINTLARVIKILNKYITDCSFNKWVDLGGYSSHNFHKLIAAIRHDLVYDYNTLIDIRVYWKNIYKIVRDHNIANQVPVTLH
jgi:hypothetical protein